MVSISIRNLDDGLKHRLRGRAVENGRSMEEEVSDILRRAVGESPPPKDLSRAIHARFVPLGGVSNPSVRKAARCAHRQSSDEPRPGGCCSASKRDPSEQTMPVDSRADRCRTLAPDNKRG